MPRIRLSIAAYGLVLLFALPAGAQPVLQSPAAFLGYEPGSRFTMHHRTVAYFEHVAAASPRVRLEYYGETYEGRPLLTAYVTSPENLSELDTIRLNNLRATGIAEGEPDGRTAGIVWLSYNVHGNESVSMEASMQTLYELADPANAATGQWLEETVVVIDPCLNPDGRDRYALLFNQRAGRHVNPRPEAWEHDEPWPGGRTNHYYFDLNRDWAWTTQQEVQARVAHYNRWMPQVHADFHEMGVDSPYFFAPAAEPFHEMVTDWQRAFQEAVGRNHARYFDANAWLYFTRQVYDLLYPGYGDSWPTYNGAIGMTYEQGGSGRAGLAILTAEGDTLTLRDRIDHHHTTGMSTVETAVAQRERLLAEFAAYFERAATDPPGPYRTYVLKDMDRADARRALETHLDRQGIRYGYAARPREAEGYAYDNGQTVRFTVQPGDMVVSAYQPKAVLLKVLFEPVTFLADSLTYDMTAWALPYAYGLRAYATSTRIEPDAATRPAPAPAPGTELQRPYAYLLPWQGMGDARFLGDLLGKGVKLRYAEQAFAIDGRSYGPGTLIVTRTGNEAMGDRFDATVRAVAVSHDRTLHPVATGFVTEGADFGSADVAFLDRPQVAAFIGAPTRSGAAGEVWHFFDHQLDYPVTLLDAATFGVRELDAYDVLVMPAGSYGEALDGEKMAGIKEWVERGGRLVAIESAVRYLAGQDGFRIRRDPAPDLPPDSAALDARRYADRERQAISSEIQGAIFPVTLDTSHPLAFGYPDTYYALKFGDDLYERLTDDDDWNVGVLAQPRPVSGFAGAEVRMRLGRHLAIGHQRMGQGDVVYMTDNPLFRGFWYNGRLLLANALFFR